MNRIPITQRDLLARIERASSGWMRKARKRTRDLEAHGCFTDEVLNGNGPPSWSAVKDVWRELQGHACAYCQRPLPITSGAVETDVEHYRPKSKCTDWKAGKHHSQPDESAHVRGRDGGYPWLAYAPWNYCTSCKVCNSTLKGTRFPIEGTPATGRQLPTTWAEVRALNDLEAPLLLFPIGSVDRDDPEALIGWEGPIAVAKGEVGSRTWRRARATLAFFNLNGREDLVRGRAESVVRLANWHRLGKLDTIVRYQAAPTLAHRACVRAFIGRLQTDVSHAYTLADAAEGILLGPDLKR